MESNLNSTPDAPPGLLLDGLLLVGHGTRESVGVAEFGELARKIAARLAPMPVAACFLELAQPEIAAGVAQLAAAGVRRLTVAPLLLFAAAHAKRDIPEAIAAAVARRPEISWRQAPHLGLDPRVFELAARRFAEAIVAADTQPSDTYQADTPQADTGQPDTGQADAYEVDAHQVDTQPTIDLSDTLLILVGRGSRDPEALAEFDEFARRHAANVGCRESRTAFMALSEPSLPEALERAAWSPFRRVVVQPHLLFGGVLVDRLRDEVAGRRRSSSAKQWVAASHLGPDELLVSAVVDLAGLSQVPLPARDPTVS